MRIAISLTVGAALLAGAQLVQATPEQDKAAFQAYFAKRFPSVPFNDYINGVYSLDKGSREQWEEIEEFPPYELDLSEGETLFNTPFKNGKSYADCFENGGIGIRQNYQQSCFHDCSKSKSEEGLLPHQHPPLLCLSRSRPSYSMLNDLMIVWY